VTNSAPDPNEKLSERLADGKLHHALIYQGNDLDEIGRHALRLTREILEMPAGNSEHPDLFHLRPSGKMRIISVDKTRTLIGELNRTSNQGGAKVAILHESDRMKKEASNAFLKTLEEPPPRDLSLFAHKPPLFDPTHNQEPLHTGSHLRLSRKTYRPGLGKLAGQIPGLDKSHV
jgi:DNA polymerase III delta prime subunit